MSTTMSTGQLPPADETPRRNPDLARAVMRTNTTAIGAVMVRRNEADSLICGTFGQYLWHLGYVQQILGTEELRPTGALSLMILSPVRSLSQIRT